jgi:hypothetical protein
MNRKVEKFLSFNGKTIVLLCKDGMWWIAIKPVCEALGVDYEAQRKAIYKNKILSQLPSEQTVVATDGKLRNMICLPEYVIYGWIFGIESSAEGLEEYQWLCYQVLYQHFHGMITGRKELIRQKAMNSMTIDRLKNKVFVFPEVQELEKLEKKQKMIDRSLRQMDDDLFDEELNLFKHDATTQFTENE